MKASPEEQLNPEPARQRLPIVELLLGAALIGGLVFYWYWDAAKRPTEVSVQPTLSTPDSVAAPIPLTPDIPQRSPQLDGQTQVGSTRSEQNAELSQNTTQSSERAPPSPTQGDTILRQQLEAVGDTVNINKLINSQHPVEISAVLIDGLGRGTMLRKVFALSPPNGEAFTVTTEGSMQYMDTASYARFDGLAKAVAALDSDSLATTFHTLRPLYENAFDKLGLNPNDFDNAVVRTLDLILATPEITQPIALKPKSVTYLYADPALESLPGLQKQLLRMGPKNIRQMKIQAKRLRETLLQGE